MASKDFDLNLEGLKELNQALSQLPNDVNEQIVKDLNRKAANIAAQVLREETPDSTSSTRRSKDKLSNAVKVVSSKTKTGFSVGYDKRKGYPVVWLQGGTRVRSIKGKGHRYRKSANRGKVNARPFVQGSFEKAIPKVLDFMQVNYLKTINQSIKKHLSRLKKS